MQSYCNTVPTPEGGTHESGLRAALTRGLKAYAELKGEKRAAIITADDVIAQAGALISVFIKNPEFQGQTKEKLSSSEAQRFVENALRDPFDHWLTGNPKAAQALLDFVIERAEERLKRRKDKEVSRASAVRKLRLPGKLADCSPGPSTAPSCSSSKATRPAARPSRRATARTRRSCPCAARSSTSPRPPARSSAPTRSCRT
jgi:topoisomerase-4 subunit B